ncbi:MAG: hypothetical protein IJW67_06035, partial [Blautia sp.]|nr:hypothetical protein [Blautia sp.]
YELEDYILETFEYGGNHFYQDMSKLAAFLEQKGVLVKKRRRDVPADELNTTSWWAPLRKLGNLISEDAEADSAKEDSEMYREMTSGYMDEEQAKYEMSYSEDDWSESIHY